MIEGRKKVPDHVPGRDGSETIFQAYLFTHCPGVFFHSCLVSFGKWRDWREQNIDLWKLNMIQCFRLKPTFSHIFSYQSPPTNMAATLSGYWKFHRLVGFSHISWEFPSHVTLLEGKGSKPNSCVKYMLLLTVNYHYSNYWGIIFQNSFDSTKNYGEISVPQEKLQWNCSLVARSITWKRAFGKTSRTSSMVDSSSWESLGSNVAQWFKVTIWLFYIAMENGP